MSFIAPKLFCMALRLLYKAIELRKRSVPRIAIPFILGAFTTGSTAVSEQ